VLNLAWEEDNTAAGKPDKVVKVLSGKPKTDGTNPFTCPQFVYNDRYAYNFAPVETVSTTNKSVFLSTNLETCGQTFNATKDFNTVGVYAVREYGGANLIIS
jgi:hypothetical protein